MSSVEINFLNQPTGTPDVMRINLAKHSVDATLSHITYIDKDTKQFVYYIPALDVSSYGETEQKANEMLQVVLDDFFDYLVNLSSKNLQKELREMGFRQTPMRNKEFSKAFVDENGQLQNLNAVENSIKRSSLSFAA